MRLIQYKGRLESGSSIISDNVKSIKIVDRKTKCILFDHDVHIVNKFDFSGDYGGPCWRYEFGAIDDQRASVHFVVQKETGLIKCMSLDFSFTKSVDFTRYLKIEYKTDVKIESDNIYDISVEYTQDFIWC